MTLKIIKKYLPNKISTSALLNRAVSTVFIFGTFIGLLPLKYDKDTNKIVKRSKFIFLWSRAVASFESSVKFVLVIWVVVQLLLNLKDFAVSELISWLLAFLFGGICSLPYYQVHIKRSVVKKVLENVLALNEELLPLKADPDLDRKLLKIFWIQIVIDTILTVFFIVGLIYDTIIRQFTLKAVLENITGAIGTFVYAFVVQTFHSGMISVAHYTEIINAKLNCQGLEVREIKTDRDKFMKTSLITKLFAEIGWNIKRLMQLQERVNKIQTKLIEIYRCVLLVMLGNIFIALVMQFQNFYMQMDTIVNHGVHSMSESEKSRFAFTICIASFVLIQHFFIVHGPELILDRTDETKRLLLDMQSICVDKEIKQSVRYFAVRMITIIYKF